MRTRRKIVASLFFLLALLPLKARAAEPTAAGWFVNLSTFSSETLARQWLAELPGPPTDASVVQSRSTGSDQVRSGVKSMVTVVRVVSSGACTAVMTTKTIRVGTSAVAKNFIRNMTEHIFFKLLQFIFVPRECVGVPNLDLLIFGRG